MTLAVGEKKAVRSWVEPARAGGRYSVRYSSSAPEIATVDSLGTVTAMAAGGAKVTIVAHADGGDGLDATTLQLVTAVTVVRP